jgi:hypothetical protein
MLINQPTAALFVLARSPGSGLDQYFDRAGGRHSEQTKAKKAAELAHTRIAQSFMPCRTNCKPNLITSSRAIYGLQYEIETEGKF